MAAFPPSSPSVQTETIPSYLYQQYADDDNLQGFIDAYNAATQTYVDWFADTALPVYTSLSAPLLDWIAQGLYGFTRPILSSSASAAFGPLDTAMLNTLEPAQFSPQASASYYTADDDTFQRILTWHLFKGDGKVISVPWVKRRIVRFLLGVNGSAPNVSDTSGVSVSLAGYAFTFNVSGVPNVPTAMLESFQYAMQGGILEMPPQFTYAVTI